MKLPNGVKTIKGDYENVRAKMNREDIVYQRKEEKNLHIRFIYPQQDNVERKYPLVMHIQGSGWKEQNLNDHILDFKDIVTAGYVLAIVEYLPIPYGVFPSQIEDMKTAMRYIIEHVDEHQVDPENIFVMGDSSGGHTALMCWATWNTRKLDTSSVPLPPVRAFIDLYGVVDLLKLREDEQAEMTNQAENKLPDGYSELIKNGSVINYISESTETEPLLILHGTKDTVVSFNQSVHLYVHAKKLNKEVTFYAVEDGDHGKSIFYNKETIQTIINFLDEHKTSNYNWF